MSKRKDEKKEVEKKEIEVIDKGINIHVDSKIKAGAQATTSLGCCNTPFGPK